MADGGEQSEVGCVTLPQHPSEHHQITHHDQVDHQNNSNNNNNNNEEEEDDEDEDDPDFVPSSDSEPEEVLPAAQAEAPPEVDEQEMAERGAALWQLLTRGTVSQLPVVAAPAPSPRSESSAPSIAPPRGSESSLIATGEAATASVSKKRSEPRALAGATPSPPAAKKSRLAQLVRELDSRSKTSTLQKSSEQWGMFKKEARVEDEMRFSLQTGYLSAQSFLKKTELKQHEQYLQGKKRS
jgi:hypothetical protein